eukprot:CAMPEP_0175060644 /NCGR_PEP_ID=MMETSP0052_2-20121109/13138_1 /TAXON_ID=51329 ORGANISM="Polytomella parva, Strain SAG 63-3" /NCGR_SAMPLE_ID=MMETSP0052_2 /ASSEMBLY_ACC=CAM_ASM_000194 /LENGTH=386 /DNA_ID=CAMNT_0016326399 /DNA_START=104 /DNA_END=1261 /DNA_ORIENTATION=-
MARATENYNSPGLNFTEAKRLKQNGFPKFPDQVKVRINQLIKGIKPAPQTDERREKVIKYMQDLIQQCFVPIEVNASTFGSVPLKTYLPDGDIDVSIFSKSPSLKETWAAQLHVKLEEESKNTNASFKITNVTVVNAEVRLLKCVVDNIVVDISYNQLGGLHTYAFLEAVDKLVIPGHMLKLSIILIKAWCYYESRVLGAHHGLISTYALETLVLYVFNLYHREIESPIDVMLRFLVEFSSFSWGTHCLSLQGPIPLSSFPNPRPEPPEALQRDPLLTEDFMMRAFRACSQLPFGGGGGGGSLGSSSFPPFPDEGAARTFPLKHLNIQDPLLLTNNLGRSVSRGNYLRIRRAFENGAKLLSAIALKDDVNLMISALDNYFKHCWSA